MLVDIFLLIISTGVPATRLNAQFNYVSILSYVICCVMCSMLCMCGRTITAGDSSSWTCDLDDEMLWTLDHNLTKCSLSVSHCSNCWCIKCITHYFVVTIYVT